MSNWLACSVFSCLRPAGGTRGDLQQLGGIEGERLGFRLSSPKARLNPDSYVMSHQQVAPEGRTPRRRWSRRGVEGQGTWTTPSTNPTLTAKSMLDLRLLDSFQEGAESEEQGLGDALAPPMRQAMVGTGLSRANQELGSTVSLQVTTTSAWVSHLSRAAGVLVHQPSDWCHFVLNFPGGSSKRD